METERFNQQKFVSVALFLLFLCLVGSGILIQIAEGNNRSMEGICTTFHVLSGIAFAIFSVVHATRHWQTLSSNFQIKREPIAASIVILAIALIVALMTYFWFAVFP